MAAVALFTRIWRPANPYGESTEAVAAVASEKPAVVPVLDYQRRHPPSLVFRAWLPWALLTVAVFCWGYPKIKDRVEKQPGVVLVQIQGDAGPVYVDAAQLRQGQYQHSPFEGEERTAIQSLVVDLADVRPLSFEEWRA